MSSSDHDKPQWKRDRDSQTGNSLAADEGPTPKVWKPNTRRSAKTDEAKQCINFQTMTKKRDDAEQLSKVNDKACDEENPKVRDDAEQFPKVNEKKADELFAAADVDELFAMDKTLKVETQMTAAQQTDWDKEVEKLFTLGEDEETSANLKTLIEDEEAPRLEEIYRKMEEID